MPRSDEERERELLSERGNKVSRKPAAEWEQVHEGAEADRDSRAAGKDKKTSKNGHQSVVSSHDIVCVHCLQVLPLPLPVLGGTRIWLTVVCTGVISVGSVVNSVMLLSLC